MMSPSRTPRTSEVLGHARQRVAHPGEHGRAVPGERLVVCAQNHDQVGNRAYGDRLPERARPLAGREHYLHRVMSGDVRGVAAAVLRAATA